MNNVVHLSRTIGRSMSVTVLKARWLVLPMSILADIARKWVDESMHIVVVVVQVIWLLSRPVSRGGERNHSSASVSCSTYCYPNREITQN